MAFQKMTSVNVLLVTLAMCATSINPMEISSAPNPSGVKIMEKIGPVIWRKTNLMSAVGAENIVLNFPFNEINPCNLLTSDKVHWSTLKSVRENCEMLFQNMLSAAIKACKKGMVHSESILNRKKRAISAMFVSSVLQWVSIGGNYIWDGIQQSNINDLYRKTAQLDSNFEALATETAHINNTLFNFLNSSRKNFEAINEYIRQGGSQALLISVVSSRLERGRELWAGTEEKFFQGIFSNDITRFYRVDLPCKDKNCMLTDGIFNSCTFDEETKTMTIQASLPIAENKTVIYQASPINLMRREGEDICTHRYTGHKYVAARNGTECVYGFDTPNHFTPNFVILDQHICHEKGNKRLQPSVSVTNCKNANLVNPAHFFHGDILHDFLVLYCPGQNITFIPSNVNVSCDENFPMAVPHNMSIQVGELYKWENRVVNVTVKGAIEYMATMSLNEELGILDLLTDVVKNKPVGHSIFNRSTHLTGTEVVLIVLGVLLVLIIIGMGAIYAYNKCRGNNSRRFHFY